MEKSSNKLVDLSVTFAVEILNLVKYLKSQHETIICNQIGRRHHYTEGSTVIIKKVEKTSDYVLLWSEVFYLGEII